MKLISVCLQGPRGVIPTFGFPRVDLLGGLCHLLQSGLGSCLHVTATLVHTHRVITTSLMHQNLFGLKTSTRTDYRCPSTFKVCWEGLIFDSLQGASFLLISGDIVARSVSRGYELSA